MITFHLGIPSGIQENQMEDLEKIVFVFGNLATIGMILYALTMVTALLTCVKRSSENMMQCSAKLHDMLVTRQTSSVTVRSYDSYILLVLKIYLALLIPCCTRTRACIQHNTWEGKYNCLSKNNKKKHVFF